jgi:helicase
MEYLVDQAQSIAAAEMLGEGLTPADLEQQIERLRLSFFRIKFNQTDTDFDPEMLYRKAYLLISLIAANRDSYDAQLIAKAYSIAATVFEYLAGVGLSIKERLNCTLNAILYYSLGEQEAQSSTLARGIGQSSLIDELGTDSNIKEAWRAVFQFLGQEFKPLLRWRRDASEDLFSRLLTSPDGQFWVDLLRGCLDVARYMVWGGDDPSLAHLDQAVAEAKSWGDSRLMWLTLTVKEVAEQMIERSLLRRLKDIGIAESIAQTLTMSSLVEMWLPHREALHRSTDLEKGILSDQARVSLINMPTSAGKSLVAEIAILFELTRNPSSKAIWVVPSRALVFEVQSRLSDHFRRIGIEISSIPGGIEADSEDAEMMANARVFVLTPEKLDGLLRRNPDLTNTVHVVVIDEMQKIGSGSRGCLFETVIAWLLLVAEQNEGVRLIFMSALLPNRADFEVWLSGQNQGFVSRWTTWRPTRLALFLTSGIGNDVWTTKLIQQHGQEVVATHNQLRRPRMFYAPLFLLHTLYDEIKQSGRTLVFFYTKDDVNTFASHLSGAIAESNHVSDTLSAVSMKFAAVYGEGHPFTTALKRGVGIDHADIPIWLRQLVEQSFRSGELPILVANQAILEGVNFPIDNLIIGSLGSGQSRYFHFRLSTLDYSNLIGRVGRAMVDTEGHCFLVWNWFYEDVSDGNLTFDNYSSATPRMDPINSTLAVDESQLINALQRLTASLDGIDESAFDSFAAVWRDRLVRLHSTALAILEQYGSTNYTQLSQWIRRTLAWHQLSDSAKEALDHYVECAWKGFQGANRPLYRLASLSGLSVRSAAEVQEVAQRIVHSWTDDKTPSFETVFSREDFSAIVNLRECWRQRPVTYGRKPWVASDIDHYEATLAWTNGEEWTRVSNIICSNYQRLNPNTLAGMVAAYVSQIFEYRLPWVLGALALAVRDFGGSTQLCNFLEELPAFVRYGVNAKAAVTIGKLCRTERSTALVLARKFIEQGMEDRDLRPWMQRISLENLREWLPSEPEILLKDLRVRLHGTRKRDWTLRREGRISTELAGWTNYEWPRVLTDIRGKSPVRFALRLEPENQYDPFAIAIDAISKGAKVHIGYVPASHAEEATELLEWGRDIEVNVSPRGQNRAPEVTLHLAKP